MVATVSDLRRAARDAVLIGTPTVRLHRSLVRVALDRLSPDFHAPLNTLWQEPPDPSGSTSAAAWLDLRGGPVVVALPDVDRARGITGQLLDLAGEVHTAAATAADRRVLVVRGPGPDPGPGRPDALVIACPTALGLLRVRPVPGTAEDRTGAAGPGTWVAATAASPGGTRPPLPPPLPDLATVDPYRPVDARFLRVLDLMMPLMPGWPRDPLLRARLALLGLGDGGLVALLGDPAARGAIDLGLADGWRMVQAGHPDAGPTGEDPWDLATARRTDPPSEDRVPPGP
jgi:hypothetical protein